MSKTAVVLLNLGGPDSLEAIEPFLKNLFSDPDIFNLPFGQKLFAKIISKRRAPKVSEEYKLIGGKSPIGYWTEKQRAMLETELRTKLDNVDVYTAMRYWNPLTEIAALKVEKGNYDKVILLPLYPHYSITTTGSSFKEWDRVFNGDKNKVNYIFNYYEDPGYISAINERIDETLLKFPEEVRSKVQLVFSPHGTPISLVKRGDPYNGHIIKTVEAVMKMRNNSHEHHICYQSKVGPIKWLEPGTDQMIEKLARENKKNLLIIPISFVSDHVETLFELDIEYRHVADKVIIENYILMEGLNDSHKFISSLKGLVLKSLMEG